MLPLASILPLARRPEAKLSSERVKHIFATIAKKYERFNAISSFGSYKLWLAGMMRQADIQPSDNVIDIAGGTGDVTFSVARAKHPAHIQCTDLVDEMLDVARAHRQTGAGGDVPIDFEVVDAQDIPYGDASFDALTMAYGIRNMPKRQQALSEMYRVLKPGGSFTCLEFSTPPHPLWRGLYHFYLKHLIPFWGGLITGDCDGFVYLSKSIEAFPTSGNSPKCWKRRGSLMCSGKTTRAASRRCTPPESRNRQGAKPWSVLPVSP